LAILVFDLRASGLLRQVLHHLSHSNSPVSSLRGRIFFFIYILSSVANNAWNIAEAKPILTDYIYDRDIRVGNICSRHLHYLI
jgi:hypothetical protein